MADRRVCELCLKGSAGDLARRSPFYYDCETPCDKCGSRYVDTCYVEVLDLTEAEVDYGSSRSFGENSRSKQNLPTIHIEQVDTPPATPSPPRQAPKPTSGTTMTEEQMRQLAGLPSMIEHFHNGYNKVIERLIARVDQLEWKLARVSNKTDDVDQHVHRTGVNLAMQFSKELDGIDARVKRVEQALR